MHHNVFWWIGVTCVIATFWLLYVQSEFGDNDRHVRKRLKAWYKFVAGDWRGLPAFAARSSDRFFSYTFGKPIISIRYITTSLGLALSINLFAYVLNVSGHTEKNNWPHILTLLQFDWQLLAINSLIDSTALALSRRYLRSVSRRTRPVVLLDLFVLAASSIASVSLSMFLGAFAAVYSAKNHSIEQVFNLFRRFSYWFLSSHGHDSLTTVSMRLYFLPAASSSIVFLAILIVGATVYLSRRLTQRPLTLILERLATAKTNLISLLIGVTGAISMLVGLFQS